MSSLQQMGVAGEPAAVSPAVRVFDQWGKPMESVRVTFTVLEGGGELGSAQAATGPDGIATSGGWTLGPSSGSNRVSAAAAGVPAVTFTADAQPGTPAAIEIVSGNEQTGIVATPLAEPVTVRVVDAHGNAVPGVAVAFAPEGGSDAVVSSLSSTDDAGVATATWTAGTRSGLQRLTARADRAGEVVFEARVSPGAAAGAEIIAGESQTAAVTQAVATPPSVRVVDAWGNGVPDVEVHFEILRGGGSIAAGGQSGSTVVRRSDAGGIAALDVWTVGTSSGANAIRATAAGKSVLFNATATAGPAASIEIHAGDGQTALIGTAVRVLPAARVLDEFDNPVPGIEVLFAVGDGGGSVTGATDRTDESGVAVPAEWKLGNAGPNTLVATSPGIGSVTFTASATLSGGGSGGSGGSSGSGGSGASDGGFYLEVLFSGSITAAQQAEFYAAAGRWATVITGDLPSVDVNIPAAACGMQHPAVNRTIDDLLVLITVVPIDGTGGILGSAGPCLVRSTGGLPVVGAVRIDEADLAFLEANGRLGDVLAHEFGHVIGIGTRWGSQLLGTGGMDPIFTGPAATAEFLGSGGSLYPGSPVPVENSGGAGTRDGHWRETVFDNELMTGWLDMSDNPLSSITIAALEDIGYEVDVNRADGFAIPAGGAAAQSLGGGLPRIELRETALPVEPIAVDAAGRPAPLRPFRR